MRFLKVGYTADMTESTDPNPSTIKPHIKEERVLQILQAYFQQQILNLQVIQGGNVAQTFEFSVGSGDVAGAGEAQAYIIRFNAPMTINFEKEAYTYERFASPSIPIPRVVQLGRLDGLHFAITEKLPGQNLLQLPRPEYVTLLPRLVEVLDAIHQVPVGERSGFGVFDGNGDAPESSWKEHLGIVREEDPDADFMGSWHTLFHTSFLERDLFDAIYQKMMLQSQFCPEERYLVHGDYGFGNVLAQEGKITAVLDWMGARYGDFLYDVAWLDFWAAHDGWRARFHAYYHQAGRLIPFFNERILCCQCYITLNAMKFFAKAGSKESYDFVTDRLRSLFRED